MSKKPKGLSLNEPLRHPDHSRPRTRREFVAQGFMTGAATILVPSVFSLFIDPRKARAAAALSLDIQQEVTACNIQDGASKIPFICFDLAGGGNIAGSNVLVGGQGGQLDFLTTAGYNKLGLPGTMLPSSSTGNFIDSTFGLRFHSDSAHLRGMKTRTGAMAMANTSGAVIPALSQNDTSINPHNPMYGIYKAGAGGALLDLIGTKSSVSGGNSMAPATMIDVTAQPTKVSGSSDVTGLVDTGQLSKLLPNPDDVTAVMESVVRISKAKLALPQVQAYSDASTDTVATDVDKCSYTKATYLVHKYNDPAALNPDVDPAIVGAGGIFTAAEYAGSSDFRKTAAVMKMVIDGNAGAGTIEMGGFDYHTGDRMTGETRDFNLGVCMGACLEYAARKGKPLMIYVFSDGSLASSGMIDNSVGGRGKGVWSGDNQDVAATYFLVFNPKGRPQLINDKPENRMQLGYFMPNGTVATSGSPAANSVTNLVQTVVLNYMALHGEDANFSTLYPGPNAPPGPNLNNTLGGPTAQQSLIAFQPLAGIVNGKIT
jgi:hypothetical protein